MAGYLANVFRSVGLSVCLSVLFTNGRSRCRQRRRESRSVGRSVTVGDGYHGRVTDTTTAAVAIAANRHRRFCVGPKDVGSSHQHSHRSLVVCRYGVFDTQPISCSSEGILTLAA